MAEDEQDPEYGGLRKLMLTKRITASYSQWHKGYENIRQCDNKKYRIIHKNVFRI